MIQKDRAITAPFEIDLNGNVAYSTNQSVIWDERVLTVLGTVAGTRLHRPTFGLSITTMPFDSRTQIEESMERAVEQAFITWLPSLTLKSVEVTQEGDDDVVTVKYTLPNQEAVTSAVIVGRITLNGPLPAEEELL